MASSFNASVASVTNQNIAALVNLNIEVSLFKGSPLAEFQPIGSALSLHRRKEAEDGPQHQLANRLGFLFNDIVPDTQKLIKAYGTRASDILQRPGINPQGTDEHGPFRDFVGADGTSIWAAATSIPASISVYLLACMLARAFDAKTATAIWVELVEERKRQVQVQHEHNPGGNPRTLAATQLEFNRGDLARWDASARSWLRRADQSMMIQKTQFKLVIDNIELPFLDSGSTFEKVTKAWIHSMQVLETLLCNKPQEASDRSVLLAISSWHLYPNLVVFQEKATKVPFSDNLFPGLAVLSLGLEYRSAQRNTTTDRGDATGTVGHATHFGWSLALSHLKYYGSAVHVRSDDGPRERITIDGLWLSCLGAMLGKWQVSISDLEDSVLWFGRLGMVLEKSSLSGHCSISWLLRICRAASAILQQGDGQLGNGMSFVRYGWRRGARFLGTKPLEPPFFGLCNPHLLAAFAKQNGTEIGFEFLRRVATHLQIPPENGLIHRVQKDPSSQENYTEWATISPVSSGCDDPSPSEHCHGPTIPSNTRWIRSQNSRGEPDCIAELDRRRTLVRENGERCHILHDEKSVPEKIPGEDGFVWKNPPPIFGGYGSSTQFTILHSSIAIRNNAAWFRLLVKKDAYGYLTENLKLRMKKAVMDFSLREGLKWLEGAQAPSEIGVYLKCFFEDNEKHRRNPIRYAGTKRKHPTNTDDEAAVDWNKISSISDEDLTPSYSYTVSAYRSLPQEWIVSLRALEITSVLYSQLPEARIPQKIIEQEFFEAKWLPESLFRGADGETSFARAINTPVDDMCKSMTRAHSFACIAMMESGRSNIGIEDTQEVIALCSDDSIFVAGILLSDPTAENLGMNVRHLIGNIGHAGIVLMISPSEPSIRSPGHDASRVEHCLYDGRHVDKFEGTSLHLSFTSWKMPVYWDDTGVIDQQLFLLESVISVRDKGLWVADLNVLRLEEGEGVDIVRFVCGCSRDALPQTKDIASLDSWEELLDLPPCVGVIRASGNWVARLAAASILAQQGQSHSIVLTEDKPICWACMTERYAWPESHLPQIIIN